MLDLVNPQRPRGGTLAGEGKHGSIKRVRLRINMLPRDAVRQQSRELACHT
jgi:hypothetical protein